MPDIRLSDDLQKQERENRIKDGLRSGNTKKNKPARHLAWRAYVSPRSSGDRFFLQRADCAGYRCCRHLAVHNED